MQFSEYIQRFQIEGKFSDPELVFKRVRNLPSILHLIDFDVFLPTIGKNLQRPYVWDKYQEQQLIESILVGRYIPPIRYVELINPNSDKEDLIQIIDGKQRLTAIIRFLENEFPIIIDNREFFYFELHSDFRFEINNYYIRGQALYQTFNRDNKPIPISDETKIKWFNLINFSGTPQEKEHMEMLIYAIKHNEQV